VADERQGDHHRDGASQMKKRRARPPSPPASRRRAGSPPRRRRTRTGAPRSGTGRRCSSARPRPGWRRRTSTTPMAIRIADDAQHPAVDRPPPDADARAVGAREGVGLLTAWSCGPSGAPARRGAGRRRGRPRRGLEVGELVEGGAAGDSSTMASCRWPRRRRRRLAAATAIVPQANGIGLALQRLFESRLGLANQIGPDSPAEEVCEGRRCRRSSPARRRSSNLRMSSTAPGARRRRWWPWMSLTTRTLRPRPPSRSGAPAPEGQQRARRLVGGDPQARGRRIGRRRVLPVVRPGSERARFRTATCAERPPVAS
jgi:hypothetical protein